MKKDKVLRLFEAAIRKREAKTDLMYCLIYDHGMTKDEVWAFEREIRRSMR